MVGMGHVVMRPSQIWRETNWRIKEGAILRMKKLRMNECATIIKWSQHNKQLHRKVPWMRIKFQPIT